VRLAEWRKQQGWKQEELASALGCTQPFISEIERATAPKIPGRCWMLKIWQLTRGAVAPNDFYDLPPIGQLELPIEDGAEPGLFDAAQADGEHQLQAAA
jgi:transcriptional regulator with XRE-family HTH domain